MAILPSPGLPIDHVCSSASEDPSVAVMPAPCLLLLRPSPEEQHLSSYCAQRSAPLETIKMDQPSFSGSGVDECGSTKDPVYHSHAVLGVAVDPSIVVTPSA